MERVKRSRTLLCSIIWPCSIIAVGLIPAMLLITHLMSNHDDGNMQFSVNVLKRVKDGFYCFGSRALVASSERRISGYDGAGYTNALLLLTAGELRRDIYPYILSG